MAAPGTDVEQTVVYLRERERTALDARELPDERIGLEIDESVGRWPEDWRLRAFKASYLVRMNDLETARAEHQAAKRLYERDPYWIDPAVGHGVGASPVTGTGARGVGGLVGAVVSLGILGAVDGAVEDEIVAYPTDPSATTWFPPEDAYPQSTLERE